VCRTPLRSATIRAHDGVATALLDSGEATVKAQDCDGKTTVVLAARL
jgi:hypothetical protein